MLKAAIKIVLGIALLTGAIVGLEWWRPSETLPPIRPQLRWGENETILVTAGMIDQLEFPAGSSELYACLERELEREFGEASAPQGKSRWARRIEVNRRLKAIESACG